MAKVHSDDLCHSAWHFYVVIAYEVLFSATTRGCQSWIFYNPALIYRIDLFGDEVTVCLFLVDRVYLPCLLLTSTPRMLPEIGMLMLFSMK